MGPILGRALVTAATQALRTAGRRRITVAFRRRLYLKLAQGVAKKAQQLDRGVREAEAKSADEALRIARELSSGRFSLAQLARMGHPYRIGGVPPQDAAIVNKQTGAFYRGWRVIGPRQRGGDLATKLVNDSPQAERLSRGTSRMIARPILTRIRERVEGKRRALYKASIRKALRS
jgi:hypothetical protein